MESINLDTYIRERVYGKNETYTQEEVITAINQLTLVNVVPSLPNTNIKDNRLYLVLNDAEIEDEHNRYDLFVHVDNRWEQIDSLEFNIDDYYTKLETESRLSFKSDTGHSHENATQQVDGFLSFEDKTKLDNLSSITVDSSLSSSSTNPVQNKVINSALGGKAPTNHANSNTTYGVGSASNYGHVKASNSNPLMNGTANVGTDNGLYARADHVHPTDTSRASNTNATSLSAGLMSASDKSKLDGINIGDYYTSTEVDTLLNNLELEGSEITIETSVTANSGNPVTSKAIKTYVDNAVSNATITDSDLINKLNTIITSMRNL